VFCLFLYIFSLLQLNYVEHVEKSSKQEIPLSTEINHTSFVMSHQHQPMTVAVATVSETSTMVTMGEGDKTSMVEISLPGQHAVQQKHDVSSEDVTGTVNSSRWTDPETMALLGLWRANYRIIKGKKRNYQEWNMIAKEFNRRVATARWAPGRVISVRSG